jgi:hypothetical protein
LTNVKVYVPHQVDYPGQFLASGDAPGLDADLKPTAPVTHLIVFARAEQETAYRAAVLAIMDPGQSLPVITVDKDGYAHLVPTAGQAADFRVSLDQVGPRLAPVMNSLRQGQAATDNPFAPGTFTTVEAAHITDLIHIEDVHHDVLSVDFSATASNTNFAYRLDDGRALTFFVLRAAVLLLRNPKNLQGSAFGIRCVALDGNPAMLLHGVPPGRYDNLAYVAVQMGAAVVPPASRAAETVAIPALHSGPSQEAPKACHY